MSARLEVRLTFRLHSGIHVTGEQAQLWTDKALVRSWKDPGHPVLPATTLKGWLRESAERLLRGLGQPACDGSRPGAMCGLCLVCELFGAPRRRSTLRFSDAVLAESRTDVRMNVSLSRHRKTAYEERLFSTEVAWQKELTAHIEGWFGSRAEAQQAAALLYVAARAGFAIGAARSRGLGWLKLKAFTASVDGKELSDEDLVAQSKALVSQTESRA
ncbi:MAG: RAMP superfamily CRISPR-associated protein [Armatimonadota bacterium]|nr:RAMP superfamily CRISPR-associated protein [Armatimonadota bacterium]MDR7444404.1 RAMP superfamily CRISPR-associated protein [Armatimonadota bacterium]MDR7570760.1 RAMP superfamily CRISPR-associated protein [Armatimonadota bacterium]MDR7614890.1 RAMP superfamily CRISPR-associated protein [Armatimonadota bacterium]